MTIVGCYTMHLYCDRQEFSEHGISDHPYGSMPEEIAGVDERACLKQARALGWRVNRKANTAICPRCLKKARR